MRRRPNTFTAGATLTPSFLRGFDMSVDYYRIKVKKRDSSVDQQTSVTQCQATGSPEFCSNVIRNANGFITRVEFDLRQRSLISSGGFGYPGALHIQATAVQSDERVNLSLFYNHKFKQEQIPFLGGPVSDQLGKADLYASQSQPGSGFKDQFTFNASFATGRFSWPTP